MKTAGQKNNAEPQRKVGQGFFSRKIEKQNFYM